MAAAGLLPSGVGDGRSAVALLVLGVCEAPGVGARLDDAAAEGEAPCWATEGLASREPVMSPLAPWAEEAGELPGATGRNRLRNFFA